MKIFKRYKEIIQKIHDKNLKFFIRRVRLGFRPHEGKYQRLLDKSSSKRKLLYAKTLHQLGHLNLERLTILNLLDCHRREFNDKQKYTLLNIAAMSSFLLGQNQDSCVFWRKCGELKSQWQFLSTPKTYRILGDAWTAAIGHVATIDFYLKYRKLYGPDGLRIVLPYSKQGLQSNDIINIMCRKFSDLGLAIINPTEIEQDYNEWASNNAELSWHSLGQNEQESLYDHFWCYSFPDGETLGYAHALSRIQKDWELAGFSPLMKVTNEESKWLTHFKEKIGLPQDAWYVCLHVREGGFHKSWNDLHPSLRDANIENYYQAIEEITKSGGWVIRMGDASMRPIDPLTHVIDYAHSPFKNPQGDFLLAATCSFFLGTNSGFATIPLNFGVPCVLTNWVPIGWPLWASQDLMIFKLFKEKKTNRYLTLEEIFERGYAFLQNIADLPKDIEVVDNTPEEIRQLTIEMLETCALKSTPISQVGVSPSILKGYEALAEMYGAYTGSRLGKHFVKQHPHVFEGLEHFVPKEQTAS